jgi:hypothetical protein
MDAASEIGGESEANRGLRPDELDPSRRTREAPKRRYRRKREERVPQGSRADGEDAEAFNRW